MKGEGSLRYGPRALSEGNVRVGDSSMGLLVVDLCVRGARTRHPDRGGLGQKNLSSWPPFTAAKAHLARQTAQAKRQSRDCHHAMAEGGMDRRRGTDVNPTAIPSSYCCLGTWICHY